MIKVILRDDSRTCTNCENTDRESFAVTIGDIVFSLCSDCLRAAASVARKAHRQSEKSKEDQLCRH